MKIGYARVSTEEQHLASQLDSLKMAGCDVVFTDQGISGAEFSRPGLDAALAKASPGDSFVVWRLDRLGRSLGKLIELINHLGRRQIDFVSLTECINTRSSGGVFMFHMMAALAEFERTLISERTRAGMAAARARGKIIGRRPALDACQRNMAIELLAVEPARQVAKRFNVHPRTLRRMMKDEK